MHTDGFTVTLGADLDSAVTTQEAVVKYLHLKTREKRFPSLCFISPPRCPRSPWIWDSHRDADGLPPLDPTTDCFRKEWDGGAPPPSEGLGFSKGRASGTRWGPGRNGGGTSVY